MRRVTRVLGAAAVLVSALAVGSVRAEEDPWADFRFLLGSWVSESKPGEPSGSFTFEPELQGKVLVRRNTASLGAAAGRPAGTHEDLMVVYREPGGGSLRASYFDSEGHMISYAVSASPDKKGLVFASAPDPASPRFRLTYLRRENARVAVKFEIAPPGKPDEFKTYLEGMVKRR
jgi:hypothetical protein